MISIMSEWLESASCIVMYTMVVTVGYDSSCLFSVFIVKKNELKSICSEANIFHIMCLILGIVVSLFFPAIM